jgi:hypothetical protein
MYESSEPPVEKKRTTGRTRPMHMGGLVAELPEGSTSERDPGPDTFHGSFPAATRAPPDSFQPAPPASNPPSGMSV